MTTKREAQKWVEIAVGKKAATVLFTKAAKMAKKGIPAKRIERAIEKELMALLEVRVARLPIQDIANHIDMTP